MAQEIKEQNSGHRERLKEKFAKEPSLVADYELLELLLCYVIPRKDVKPMAKNILDKAGSLADMLYCDVMGIAGVGKQTELFFAAVRELCDRCAKARAKTEEKLNSPAAVYDFLKFSVAMGHKESFAVICLNGKLGVISHEVIGRGTVNAASVFPREVAEVAVRAGAVSVIVAHNHPSGDATPTEDDIETTRKIKVALSALDIVLSDHVILTKNSYFSFREKKLL